MSWSEKLPLTFTSHYKFWRMRIHYFSTISAGILPTPSADGHVSGIGNPEHREADQSDIMPLEHQQRSPAISSRRLTAIGPRTACGGDLWAVISLCRLGHCSMQSRSNFSFTSAVSTCQRPTDRSYHICHQIVLLSYGLSSMFACES